MLKLNKNIEAITDLFLRLIPAFTIGVLLIFYTIISLYYDYFGIEIIHYMDGSEILFSFLPFFKISILPVAIIYGALYFYGTYFASQKWYSKWFIGPSIIIACIVLPYFLYSESQGQHFGLFTGITALTILILRDKKEVETTDNKTQISKRILFILLVGLITTSFAVFYLNKIRKIRKGGSEKNISFQMDEKVVTTDKDTIYIGQTRNYIFLFDRKRDKTLIYKMNDLTNLAIK